MKRLVTAAVITFAGAGALPASARPITTFQLDEKVVEEVWVDTGEVDHNADDMVMAQASSAPVPDSGTVEVIPPAANDVEMPRIVVVKPDAAPVATPTPVVVAPTATPAPVVKPVAPLAKAKPQDIPLIETKNEAHSSPEVTYVTGGIGDDEQAAIQAAKPDYNLYVMSASKAGAFVGDARVVITRKNGKDVEEMLNVVAGPLLYVKLVDGSYALDATLGEMKKHQDFTINSKHKAANVHLSWDIPATMSGE
ncbi:MAG: hypothetical protein ACOYNL_03565 [Rickettsiales bacterium]